MELGLTDLTVLIQLAQKEQNRLQKIINSSASSEEEIDDSGEYSMLVSNAQEILKQQYEAQWSADCDFPGYQELMAHIDK